MALTRHRENVTLYVATETASDLGRLARQMARVDDCRAASQFHRQENPEPRAPVDLAQRRAQVEEAAARRRHAARDTLTKAARADYVPGGRRRATVEDVACELSPEYADRVKYGDRLRGLIARTEKAMQDRDSSARGFDNGVDVCWWHLNWAQKTLHVTGLWRDKQLEQYKENAEGARHRHDRLAARRGALIEKLAVTERLAAAALDKIRPEATRVLSQRQREAAAARAALDAIREAAPRARTNPRARPRPRPLAVAAAIVRHPTFRDRAEPRDRICLQKRNSKPELMRWGEGPLSLTDCGHSGSVGRSWQSCPEAVTRIHSGLDPKAYQRVNTDHCVAEEGCKISGTFRKYSRKLHADHQAAEAGATLALSSA